jgi:pilus assembly protein CpaC
LRSRPTAPVLLAGLLCCSWLVGPAAAQQPGAPPGIAPAVPIPPLAPAAVPFSPAAKEPPCDVPPVPDKPPKTKEAAELVESAHCNDAFIEVVAGQSRIVIVKEDLQTPKKAASLYVGDPEVADITFVPPLDPKVIVPRPAIRVLGKKPGVTDLVIQTPDDRIFKFEVRVVANPEALRAQEQARQAALAAQEEARQAELRAREARLQEVQKILNARLQCLFPDASLKVTAVGERILVEGEARSTAQVAQILNTVRGAIGEIQTTTTIASESTSLLGTVSSAVTTSIESRIINMIRVVGSQQVLLKVRVAELNRTALRRVGADFLAFDKTSPFAVGTSLGNATIGAAGILTGNTFTTTAVGSTIPGLTTTFGVFSRGDFEIFFSALRRNSLLKILAEPNLVAMNGQRANFLAGGQFFIPTSQTAIGGVAGGISATPVDFGVRLDFLAHIIDGDLIRLTVDPEVSQPDFTVATTLVAGGSPVPGLNKRSAHTTVELRQGQTLAIAGLMQVTLDGTTSRLPGLGDLPILGPFFSNTTGSRTEKELLVLVTPYLVEAMNPDQVPPTPGDEVKEPNDLEFFLLDRIEGRTGVDFRSTTHYDDAVYVLRCLLRLHEHNVRGPNGYCE